MGKTLADLLHENITALRQHIVDQVDSAYGETLRPQAAAIIRKGLDLQDEETAVDQADLLFQFDELINRRLGVRFRIPADDKLPQWAKGAKFSCLLAEPLLHEASLLLDRCIQQRREHDDLRTRLFEICIELDQLESLNDIIRKEEADYHIPVDIIQAKANAMKAVADSYSSLKNTAQAALTAANTVPGRPGQLTAAQAEMAKIEVAINNEKDNQMKFEADQSLSQRRNEINLQVQRNRVSRLVASRRAKQIKADGGALNFGEQMKTLKQRFDNDLVAAYLRLKAVADGFTKLYQCPADFPAHNDQRELDFDELVTWCQSANTWLASFVDRQQQVTRSFSLAQLMSDQGGDFNDGATSARWQFRLGEEHFYHSRFVRLRGFAVQIDSGHFSGNWNVAVTPPKEVVFRNELADSTKLSQDVGRLYLGRVNETTFQVTPEAAAPPKLYNASPIGQDVEDGKWTIEIIGYSTNHKPPSSINDISMHFTVALI